MGKRVTWTQQAARGFARPILSNCIDSFLPAQPLGRTGYLNGGTCQREASVPWSLACFSCRPIPKPQLRFVLSPLLLHSKTYNLHSGLVLPFWQVLVCKKNHVAIVIVPSLFQSGALEACSHLSGGSRSGWSCWLVWAEEQHSHKTSVAAAAGLSWTHNSPNARKDEREKKSI